MSDIAAETAMKFLAGPRLRLWVWASDFCRRRRERAWEEHMQMYERCPRCADMSEYGYQKIKNRKLVSSLYERLCVSCNYKWFALKTDTGMQPVTIKGDTIYYGGNHIQEEVSGQRQP